MQQKGIREVIEVGEDDPAKGRRRGTVLLVYTMKVHNYSVARRENT